MKINTIQDCYENAPPHLFKKMIQFRNDYTITQFEYRGRIVEYIATGVGKNTLLMFHGALGSADTPYTEILRLRNQFKVITPTIRDLGSLNHISDAVNEILQREQVGKLFVRGGSFGAFIAQSYFRRNFNKIDRLVLTNGIPPKGEYSRKDHRYVRLFKLLFKIMPERVAKKIMLKELGKLGKQSHKLTSDQQQELDFLMMQVQERLAKVRKRHILESLMLVVEFDLNETMKLEDFHNWNGKILLITDTEDSSYNRFEKLKAQFPNPHSKIFEKSGHILQIVYKSEFERIHDEFLAN